MPRMVPASTPSTATKALSARNARRTVRARKPRARSTPMVRRRSRTAGHHDAQAGDADEQAQAEIARISAACARHLFVGNTLRGLLLYGYAFATIGVIAGYAAIVAFAGAAVLFVLVGFGFWHSRRASDTVAAESQPVGAHA